MRAFENNKNATGLPLWLLYIKKPWGLINHPWLFLPILGMALWVTRFKIKVEVIKIKASVHDLSFRCNIKHIGSGMSRGNFQPSLAPESFFLTGKRPVSPP
jgi:hypothetical protein